MREREFIAAIADWQMPLPNGRFAIYRNNVVAALAGALRVRFPVTEQLVGSAFFSAMARAFADVNRPDSPVLITYGGGFPDFIRTFAPARSVPYLGDVAALESLWWQAYHAGDVPVMHAADLAAVPAEDWEHARFRFHPSVGLMSSPFAIARIWQAHHGGAAMGTFDVRQAETALVHRSGTRVATQVIPESDAAFLPALLAGNSLGDAVASIDDPAFDLTAALRFLLDLNIICGLYP